MESTSNYYRYTSPRVSQNDAIPEEQDGQFASEKKVSVGSIVLITVLVAICLMVLFYSVFVKPLEEMVKSLKTDKDKNSKSDDEKTGVVGFVVSKVEDSLDSLERQVEDVEYEEEQQESDLDRKFTEIAIKNGNFNGFYTGNKEPVKLSDYFKRK